LKHDIESKKVQVDKAFAKLDDLVRVQEGKANPPPSTEQECHDAKEKLVVLGRLMEAMSKLNASYKAYTQMLEEHIGF
jgi:hypothetical protein